MGSRGRLLGHCDLGTDGGEPCQGWHRNVPNQTPAATIIKRKWTRWLYILVVGITGAAMVAALGAVECIDCLILVAAWTTVT